MSSKKQTSFSRMQPWLFTFVHSESLQRFKVLCFGRTAASAEAHFRAVPGSESFDFVDCFMLQNDKFVCFASLSNLSDLSPWIL